MNDRADAARHCGALVRRHNRDAWLSSLFAPASKRPHLHALYAFDWETRRVRSVVSEPPLGEIRLQWWGDALADRSRSGHPVADALRATVVECGLPLATLQACLAARVFDLYDDPMPDVTTLQGYAGETDSAVTQLAAMVLDADAASVAADASGHAGVALTVTRLLAGISDDPARWQPVVPADIVARHRASRGDLVGGTATPAVAAVLDELRTMARSHLADAFRAMPRLSATLRPAYLRLATLERVLNRSGSGARPELSPWRRQWLIWRLARRWR